MTLSYRKRPRILCLHGRCQDGSIFSNKISGARRKLDKVYDLIFLDAPLQVKGEPSHSLAWWSRFDDDSNNNNNTSTESSSSMYHTSIQRALEYVQNHPMIQGEGEGEPTVDALLGFSQGGTLATALALSGCFKGVRAVVTAGAPYIPEAIDVAHTMASRTSGRPTTFGYKIPKLHMAGQVDSLVPVESTRMLCEKGGCGQMIIHEQGHLFPTRSAPVTEIMNFLLHAFRDYDGEEVVQSNVMSFGSISERGIDQRD